MKKFLSVVICAVLAIGTLAGCGAKDGKVRTVRVWSSDGGTKEFMTKKVDEFNKTTGAKENIKIEYRVVTSGMDDMTKSAFENNDGPELFGGSLNTIKQYRKQGYAIPLEELKNGKDILKNMGVDIPETEINKYDGKVYTVPVKTITGGLVYNKDLFKKSGIVDDSGNAKPPQTWDEFVEDCKIITQKNKGKYGVAFPMKDGFVWGYAMGWGYSASYDSNKTIDFENGEYHSEYGIKYLNYMLKVKKDNSCFPGSESLDNDTLRLQFSEGNIGMFFGCSWDVGVLTEQFPAKCDWAVAEYPVEDVNEKYLQQSQVSSTLSIGNSAVKTSEMSEAVSIVYEWMYSDDMLKEMYEKQFAIPYSTRVAEAADSGKMSSQWVDFCKMAEISRAPSDSVSIKVEGDSSGVLFEKVWMGQLTVDEVIKDMNKRWSDGLKKGLEDKSIDPSAYKTQNLRRK